MQIHTLLAMASVATAHFHLVSPPSRGFNADTMATFPCGSLSQMTDRTKIPLSGSIPIDLKLGHTQTALTVLLGLGNDPGTNYNITLHPTFGVQGAGEFCLADVEYNAKILGVDVVNGMNATLQVQSNGDPQGGLYACADVQFFSNATIDKSSCSNDTKLQAVQFTGDSAKRTANVSTASGSAQGSSSSSKENGGRALELASWGVFGAALMGAFALM
ncbi:GPI anchored protein [Penicillium cosmopolitanum]|uniref:GPI anchored protein n=1 Tax=Penicillium cosmopolitanum TaxID=1131564 RepID=A0A9W9VEW1_9EURO|nr:GPI anchored protein [Penicillium cosmopolitanum]KAJ5376826.1 GPI anchored protein [Penicillium cosmopolitanum]